jgi:hypothetical protein
MHTPGPWRWQGEDYRGGWGWQMLVGPNGEGLIHGGPIEKLRAFVPMDPAFCITGLAAEGKERVEAVFVFGEDNARLIAAAPDLLHACQVVKKFLDKLEEGTDEGDPLKAIRRRTLAPLHEALDAALKKI